MAVLHPTSILNKSETDTVCAVCCSQSSGPTQQDKDEWVPGDGWFAWATKTPHTAPANQLDRLRAELRTEFNAAVRHAYLGPR